MRHLAIVSPVRVLLKIVKMWVAVAVALLVGCGQTVIATPEPVTIRIAGATAMQPALQLLTEEFRQQHPNVLFDLRGGGSQLGEDLVADGQIDLAASSIIPVLGEQAENKLEPDVEVDAVEPPEENSIAGQSAALGKEKFDGSLTHIPVALDGLAIIVHKNNPLQALSLLQLRDIFSGEVLDWEKVGNAKGDILLISREDNSGARMLFDERVMGGEGVSLTAVVMPTSADVVEYVASHTQAIGYVSRSYVADALVEEELAELEQIIRVIELEGRRPDIASLRSQEYYLTYPLYFVKQEESSGWATRFVDFVLSPTGQGLLSDLHAPVR